MDGHRTLLFHPNPRCGGTSSLSIKCFKKNEKRDIFLLSLMMDDDTGSRVKGTPERIINHEGATSSRKSFFNDAAAGSHGGE